MLALAARHHSVRVEAGEGDVLQAGIVEHERLEEQRPRTDAPNALERQLRMLQVVETP